jgi:hypothetical protein
LSSSNANDDAMKVSKSKLQKNVSAKAASGRPEGATAQPATVETVALNLLAASRGRGGAGKSVRVSASGFKPLGSQNPTGDESISRADQPPAEPEAGRGMPSGAKCD